MPGWWKATDGNWYPPEVHPSRVNDASVQEQEPIESASAVGVLTQTVAATSQRRTLQIAGVLTLTVLLLAGGIVIGVSLAGGQKPARQSMPPTSPAAIRAGPAGSNSTAVGTPVPTTGASTTSTSAPPATSSPGGTVPVSSGAPTYPTPSTAVGSSPDLITPTVETAVVSSTWAGLTTALVYGNQSEIPTYATSSATNALVGTLDCGCGPGPPSYSAVNFSAVPQSTYPLFFLAEFQGQTYSQTSDTHHVVFSKATATAPWLVAFDADFTKGQPFLPSSMMTSIPGPDMGPTLRQGAQSFSDYFQSVDSTGQVGTGLPTGFATDNILSSVVSGSAAEYPERASAGLTDQYTHSIDAISPTFPVNGDGTELCFAMRVEDLVSPVGSAGIVQPPDQSVWGNWLAPGTYHHVDIVKEAETCLVTAPDQAIYMVANGGATYHQTAS
jgi:hypothetical protein